MSIFAPLPVCSDSIFAPSACLGGTQTTLSFVRSAALVQQRSPTQSPAGEVLLSFLAVGTVTGELQPTKSGVQRLLAGHVVDVAYTFYVLGLPDVQELDRAMVEGRQVEVVAVNQFGTMHAEIQLRWLGR